ncbi:Tat pathway signal sequence domain protein [Streptomyces sp. NPDC051940]|uniref:glycosyl hydrolase family 95 catalytic domain-containing protein n=1 Tax=Streptomyces sp. NPDC051940 TaxID=3155675 RepID=UPI00341D44F6
MSDHHASRRTVLGGIALGGAAALAPGGLPPSALAATPEAPAGTPEAPSAPWDLDVRMTADGQWAEFLAGQDLLWGRMPANWYEGPFLGDGELGSMIYKEPGANAVRFTVQHGRVQDHRPQFGSGWGTARLPVGHLTLDPVGTITGVDWRLSLWNGEFTGTVTTTAGTLTVTAFVHDGMFASYTEAGGDEQVRWTFHPEEAISPRKIQENPPAGYTPNPPWTTAARNGVSQVVQPLTGGGQTATAYRYRDGVLVLNVAHTFPSETAADDSYQAVRDAAGFGELQHRNRAWWHAFYKKSFVSLPDQRLQSFHWIQLYKTACASRAGGPVMATTGPWLEPTPWPAVWWNLNVQLEYWLIHGSNHLELDSLTSTLDANRDQLVQNVPAAYREDSAAIGRSADMFCTRSIGLPGTGGEAGNLPWALHNVWLTYRHTMDDALLRDTVFPLLRRAVNFYLHALTTGDDGRLHIPRTLSPEYPVVPPRDTNYDLALLRWGCLTLLESADRLGIDDPLAARWREVLDTLVPYPRNADGFMIGAETPYAESHRHYSHLLMVYPLYLVNWDQEENRELIERSVLHWHSMTSAHRGYSFTGAASMFAMMGRGDVALDYLSRFFDPSSRYPCRPNTHYAEGGPVIETPLSASQSIHDMLCQSWGGTVRVFPAVPGAWPDVTLHDFRTQGAFLLSAVRKGGVTRFVRIRSLAGEPLRVRHGLEGPLTALLDDGTPARVTDPGDGTVEVGLPKDREVLLYGGTRPDLVIAPVRTAKPGDAWGLPPVPPPGETVPVDLAPYLDNDGISAESNMTDGNFDGSGYTYPAEEMPPPGPLTHEGLSFTFPSYADGQPNNVTGQGQTLAVPAGRYAKVRLLGAASSGTVTSTLTATYADGSTASVPFVLADWGQAPGAGATEVLRCTHRHGAGGTNSLRVGIFEVQAPLDPARELRSLTLPVHTRPQIHLFGLSLERPRA